MRHNAGFSYDGHRIITCDALTMAGGVRHGFSTRLEGISSGIYSSLNLGVNTDDEREKVRCNFALLSQDVGISVSQLVLARQIHSTRVYHVKQADAGKGLLHKSDLPEVDALITNQTGVCLATFYADCTPILFFDPVKRVIASVHSGWRGSLGQIARQAVISMEETYGCHPADILAAMGPSIKQCHFEVDEDVYLKFVDVFGEVATQNTKRKEQKYYIDTDALNVHTLLASGLLREHISVCPDCTYCDEKRFFSHRREGSTGRMCAVIALQ